MIYINNNILIIKALLFCGLLSCQCDTVKDKILYEDGNIKTITTKNCTDELLKYEHYTVDGELAFSLNYKKDEPLKPFEGRPWVHLIWNNMHPFIGDTIYLEVHLVTPPKLEVKFSIEDNDGIVKNLKIDKYIYSKVANDTVEIIPLKAVFLLNKKKWVTVKKSIQLKCETRPLNNGAIKMKK